LAKTFHLAITNSFPRTCHVNLNKYIDSLASATYYYYCALLRACESSSRQLPLQTSGELSPLSSWHTTFSLQALIPHCICVTPAHPIDLAHHSALCDSISDKVQRSCTSLVQFYPPNTYFH